MRKLGIGLGFNKNILFSQGLSYYSIPSLLCKLI